MSNIEGLLEHHSALPLGSRCLLRFQGPDRLRYLNGQLTQDLRDVPADQSLHSCVTDPKGRLLADIRVFDHDDALWLDASTDLRETLPDRLDRYLVADEVEWSDQSDHWHLLHLVGEAPVSMAGSLPSPPAIIRRSNRLGIPGLDVWLPADDSVSLPTLINQFGTLDPERAETTRIAHGIPAWGTELTKGMLPPEAGLDRDAISYTKGCYVGQEVLSRIHSVGRVNRQLVLLQLDPTADPADLLGAKLQDPENQAEVGLVTSISPLVLDGDQQRNALGYRSRKSEKSRRFQLITPTGTIHAVAREPQQNL